MFANEKLQQLKSLPLRTLAHLGSIESIAIRNSIFNFDNDQQFESGGYSAFEVATLNKDLAQDAIVSLDFFPIDESVVAAAGGSQVLLLSTEFGKLVCDALSTPGKAHCIRFSPGTTLSSLGGRFLAVAAGQNCYIYDTSSSVPRLVREAMMSSQQQQQQQQQQQPLLGPAPPGFTYSGGEKLQGPKLVGSQLEGHRGAVHCLTWSGDSRLLASCSHDSSVRVYEVTTQKAFKPLAGHHNSQPIRAVAFAPNGEMLASAGDDKSICLYNVPANASPDTNNNINIVGKLNGHLDRVETLCFHPEGQILASGSSDAAIFVWDVNHKPHPVPLTAQPLLGHTKGVRSLRFCGGGAPDKNEYDQMTSATREFLLLSSSSDGTVFMWSQSRGWKPLGGKPLNAHRAEVCRDALLSMDGRMLVSASNVHQQLSKGELKFWYLSFGRMLGSPLQCPKPVVHIKYVFAGDGQYLRAKHYPDGSSSQFRLSQSTDVVLVPLGVTCKTCGTEYDSAPKEFKCVNPTCQQFGKDPIWQPDTPKCQRCREEFGVFTRRTHCRGCSKCLCKRCCSQKCLIWDLHEKHPVCVDCVKRARSISHFKEIEQQTSQLSKKMLVEEATFDDDWLICNDVDEFDFDPSVAHANTIANAQKQQQGGQQGGGRGGGTNNNHSASAATAAAGGRGGGEGESISASGKPQQRVRGQSGGGTTTTRIRELPTWSSFERRYEDLFDEFEEQKERLLERSRAEFEIQSFRKAWREQSHHNQQKKEQQKEETATRARTGTQIIVSKNQKKSSSSSISSAGVAVESDPLAMTAPSRVSSSSKPQEQHQDPTSASASASTSSSSTCTQRQQQEQLSKIIKNMGGYDQEQKERLRKRVVLFYEKHSPENCCKIEVALQKEDQEEQAMFSAMCIKYTVDPENEKKEAISAGCYPPDFILNKNNNNNNNDNSNANTNSTNNNNNTNDALASAQQAMLAASGGPEGEEYPQEQEQEEEKEIAFESFFTPEGRKSVEKLLLSQVNNNNTSLSAASAASSSGSGNLSSSGGGQKKSSGETAIEDIAEMEKLHSKMRELESSNIGVATDLELIVVAKQYDLQKAVENVKTSHASPASIQCRDEAIQSFCTAHLELKKVVEEIKSNKDYLSSELNQASEAILTKLRKRRSLCLTNGTAPSDQFAEIKFCLDSLNYAQQVAVAYEHRVSALDQMSSQLASIQSSFESVNFETSFSNLSLSHQFNVASSPLLGSGGAGSSSSSGSEGFDLKALTTLRAEGVFSNNTNNSNNNNNNNSRRGEGDDEEGDDHHHGRRHNHFQASPFSPLSTTGSINVDDLAKPAQSCLAWHKSFAQVQSLSRDLTSRAQSLFAQSNSLKSNSHHAVRIHIDDALYHTNGAVTLLASRIEHICAHFDSLNSWYSKVTSAMQDYKTTSNQYEELNNDVADLECEIVKMKRKFDLSAQDKEHQTGEIQKKMAQKRKEQGQLLPKLVMIVTLLFPEHRKHIDSAVAQYLDSDGMLNGEVSWESFTLDEKRPLLASHQEGAAHNVFLARNIADGRRVVLKEYPLTDSFYREVQQLSRLSHPYVLSVESAFVRNEIEGTALRAAPSAAGGGGGGGEPGNNNNNSSKSKRQSYNEDEDGIPTNAHGFIVYRYVDGGNLKTWLMKHGQTQPHHVMRVLHQVLQAIQHLHQQPHPIIWNECTAKNVLMTSSNENANPLIFDFDLTSTTLSQEFVNTSRCLAPEVKEFWSRHAPSSSSSSSATSSSSSSSGSSPKRNRSNTMTIHQNGGGGGGRDQEELQKVITEKVDIYAFALLFIESRLGRDLTDLKPGVPPSANVYSTNSGFTVDEVDMLSRCLEPDFQKRLSAEQLLKHRAFNLAAQAAEREEKARQEAIRVEQQEQILSKKQQTVESERVRIQQQEDDLRKKTAPPAYWKISLDHGSPARQQVARSERIYQLVCDSFEKTSITKYIGQGRDNYGLSHVGYEVLNVWRLEHPELWKKYVGTRKAMSSKISRSATTKADRIPRYPGLEWADTELQLRTDVNEMLLFHGTKTDIAELVCRQGFDPRVCSDRGLFGSGIYFSSNSSKSDEYCVPDATGSCWFIVTRVLLGKAYHALKPLQNIRRPSCLTCGKNIAIDGSCPLEHELADSIFGPCRDYNPNAYLQKYNEYIVYDSSQAYPEMLVEFRRK